MKARDWVKIIREKMADVGTYKPSFDKAIETLSSILEQRDAAYSEFVKGGSQIIIDRRSDRGAVNSAKNPLFVAWMDLNSQALAYWRDLGLTPAGLKRIDEESMRPKKKSALAEALKEMEL